MKEVTKEEFYDSIGAMDAVLSWVKPSFIFWRTRKLGVLLGKIDCSIDQGAYYINEGLIENIHKTNI